MRANYFISIGYLKTGVTFIGYLEGGGGGGGGGGKANSLWIHNWSLPMVDSVADPKDRFSYVRAHLCFIMLV